MCFNALQAPLLSKLAEQHSRVKITAYADDLVLYSLSKRDLEATLEEVSPARNLHDARP